MSSECKKVEENLIDLAQGTIPEALKVEIDRHLQGCTECAHLFHRFSLSWQEFSPGERKSPPPSSFWPGLIKRIEDAERRKPLQYRILAGVKNSLRPAFAALILLSGVFLGYHLGQIPEEAVEAVTARDLFVEYSEAFEDFPPGSGADFFLSLIQEQDEMP